MPSDGPPPTILDLTVVEKLLAQATAGPGFYGRAAAATGEFRSQLCAAMDRVEGYLGTDLLTRSPSGRRRCILTEAGQRFRDALPTVLVAWEAARRAAKGQPAPPDRQLPIG